MSKKLSYFGIELRYPVLVDGHAQTLHAKTSGKKIFSSSSFFFVCSLYIFFHEFSGIYVVFAAAFGANFTIGLKHFSNVSTHKV